MSFIGRTRILLSLSGLRNLVSDSMAIDMGSASTIIAVRGRGVVVDEPSVVAVNKITGEVIAVGNEAHKMQGREARDVTVIAPLVDGVGVLRVVGDVHGLGAAPAQVERIRARALQEAVDHQVPVAQLDHFRR